MHPPCRTWMPWHASGMVPALVTSTSGDWSSALKQNACPSSCCSRTQSQTPDVNARHLRTWHGTQRAGWLACVHISDGRSSHRHDAQHPTAHRRRGVWESCVRLHTHVTGRCQKQSQRTWAPPDTWLPRPPLCCCLAQHSPAGLRLSPAAGCRAEGRRGIARSEGSLHGKGSKRIVTRVNVAGLTQGGKCDDAMSLNLLTLCTLTGCADRARQGARLGAKVPDRLHQQVDDSVFSCLRGCSPSLMYRP